MNHFSGKVIKTISLCVFLFTGINGCKDDYTSVVPYVYVNMNINPANYIEFNIPGGAVYFENYGYGGVIIVNNWGDTTTPFLAFDATCTYEVLSTVKVEVTDSGSGVATCPTCGSQFMLLGSSGSPIKGPAKQPLRQYHCFTSNGRIIVNN